MYVDRNFVKSQKIDSSYDLGVRTFKECIFSETRLTLKITDYLLENVTIERGGELIDKESMWKLINLLIEVDAGSKSLYKEIFEIPFLSLSHDFYEK